MCCIASHLARSYIKCRKVAMQEVYLRLRAFCPNVDHVHSEMRHLYFMFHNRWHRDLLEVHWAGLTAWSVRTYQFFRHGEEERCSTLFENGSVGFLLGFLVQGKSKLCFHKVVSFWGFCSLPNMQEADLICPVFKFLPEQHRVKTIKGGL